MEERMRQVTFTKKQPPYNSGERAGFPESKAKLYVDAGNAVFSDDLEPVEPEAEIVESDGTAEDVTVHDDDDRSAADDELGEVDRESDAETTGDEELTDDAETTGDEEPEPDWNKIHSLTVDEAGDFIATVSSVEELQKYTEAEAVNPDWENGRQGVYDYINERIAEIQENEKA